MCYLNAVDSPPRRSLSSGECEASLALTSNETPAGVELTPVDGGDSRPIAEIPSITKAMITATRARIDALHARSTLVRETTLMEALAEVLDLLEGTARRTGVIRIDALLGAMVGPLRRGVDPHQVVKKLGPDEEHEALALTCEHLALDVIDRLREQASSAIDQARGNGGRS